ncbi:MAG TPA: SDR family NAD(P)-dependent oxidoreductase, partial [Pseudonocardiaceae bacterium]
PTGPAIRRGGRYLILGGHGGLGVEVAARFAREGADLVALVSRSGAPAGGDASRVAAIEALGCVVASFAADITASGELAAVVRRLREEHGDLHGVVHAAGTLRDGLIRTTTPADVAAVLGPKVDGVHRLAAAVAGQELDFAVLFASVSGAFGNLGQAGYAAANAYLDAFAHSRGAPWTSIDWGLWGEVGMGTAVADQLRRRGVRPLGTAEALDALLAVLRGPHRQVVIAHPDAVPGATPAPPITPNPAATRPLPSPATTDPVSTVLATTPAPTITDPAAGTAPAAATTAVLATATAVSTTPTAATSVPVAGEPGGRDAGERVADELARFMAERLGVPVLDRDAPLADYGMNSIMSVELSEELSRRWGTALPATIFLEYGDFHELADALATRYGAIPPAPSAPEPAAPANATSEPTVPAPAPAAPAAVTTATTAVSGTGTPATGTRTPATGTRTPAAGPGAPVTTPAVAAEIREPRPIPLAPSPGNEARPDDVAIVAVSGDLPGAPDLDGLWELLRSGRDAFTEIPAERWDIEAHHQERGPSMTGTYCRLGAFVPDIHRLDPRFFGISVREADEMDPQQKLLLEHAWSVLDEGGAAGRRDVGVYVGATYTHHRDAAGLDQVGPHTALGSMNAVLANRISYALDLTGPSQTVDTLCSSSLVAVQQAVAALRAGQCGAAIVAACHVGLTPWYYRSLSQLGALSADRPRPFDDRADGFVPGEGAVAVLLKRLADAERDGDRIWGVVRGAAVNHGGRGSALPVPRSEAQVAVIRAALADAGLEPSDVSLVETHGTATRLGDPIEIAALTEVFAGAGPVHIGSVKANLGHLEPASGLAGLVKVLLCLRHQEIPPLAGFATPGAHVDLSSGRIAVPTRPTPWTPDGPRRAGISAFGMGGTNAHVVVEEYVPGPATPEPGGEHALVLSAHSADGLARRIADVERMVAADRLVPVRALCFSAAVGRAHLLLRVAVLGATADELGAGLRHLLGRPGDPAGTVVRGAAVVAAAEPGTAADLALRHVAGGSVDWRAAYADARPGRIPLPPYPFRPDSREVEVDGRLLAGHRVLGRETVPGALLLASALAGTPVLEGVAFTARITGGQPLRAVRAAGRLTFRHGDRPVAHLTPGTAGPGPAPAPVTAAGLRARYARTMDPAGLYAWFAARGMELAPPLTAITGIHYGAGGVLATVDPGPEPALGVVVALDTALQSMAVLTLADRSAPPATYLPVTVGRVTAWGAPETAAFVHLRLITPRPHGEPAGSPAAGPTADGARRATVTLHAADGTVLAALEDVEYRPVATTPPAGTANATAAATPAPAAASNGASVAAGGRTAPAVRRAAASEQAVLALVRSVMRDTTITPITVLSAAGLDSMIAAMIAAEIEQIFGVGLGPIDVLDARDCRSLAAAVAELLPATPEPGVITVDLPADPAVTTPTTPAAVTGPVTDAATETLAATGTEPTASQPDRREDLAVVGLACALPGAGDAEAFWSLLLGGGTGVGEAPGFRWNGSGPTVGGFLENIAEFDARFFEFFPKQAEVLDPQVRWLLRTTWEALESAGVAPLSVARSTGVFVGASYQHYKDFNLPPELDAPSGLGNHNAFLANRVSYFLDLNGPSMTIDTLCSSSLVALHTAVRSIRDGECEQAIVAGVRLAMSPLHYTAMTNLRALSATGASRAFDAGADGFVPGEGVVTVVIKPLSAALRDGDRVRGVIRGTAV